jgi:hypothetical protein
MIDLSSFGDAVFHYPVHSDTLLEAVADSTVLTDAEKAEFLRVLIKAMRAAYPARPTTRQQGRA